MPGSMPPAVPGRSEHSEPDHSGPLSSPAVTHTFNPVRTLAVLAMLLGGCTPAQQPASAARSPTDPSDGPAASACTKVVRAAEEQVTEERLLRPIRTSISAGRNAVLSTDLGIQKAGRHLELVGIEAMQIHGTDDPDPAEMRQPMERVGEAQRELLSACIDLFGPQPWAFTAPPTPEASNRP